jgi:hypothetical protein
MSGRASFVQAKSFNLNNKSGALFQGFIRRPEGVK